MTALSMNYRFDKGDSSRRVQGMVIVVALHALLGYALATGMARKGLNLIKKPLQAVVLQEVVLPPLPPVQPQHKEIRTQEPLAVKTVSTPHVQQDVPPPLMSPMELSQRDSTRQPLTTEMARAEPAPTPVPDSAEAQAVSMENEYAHKVRAILNAIKRYPTGRSASQQRPQGKVKLWFTLTREGTLVDAGILESSNSNLLDDAAIATVRRGSYPPFPANTWVDRQSHKFSAEIEFNPPSA